MTKSTMINTIQERELELYESLRLAKRVFGKIPTRQSVDVPLGIAYGC